MCLIDTIDRFSSGDEIAIKMSDLGRLAGQADAIDVGQSGLFCSGATSDLYSMVTSSPVKRKISGGIFFTLDTAFSNTS